ncbi:MAG: lipopolysaccharide kinase InaA family protein [Thermoanaerobaculia bacterium]|nr:lipopolysaccharide kinase InaA family protein [Thermoanaerobaculia bacterium]
MEQVLDPATAIRILHWGRNILWIAEWPASAGSFPVVVKQFRHEGRRKRWDRRLRGSKAERNWRMALSMSEDGVPTPEPVAWVERRDPEGPAFFVCRYLEGVTEARYPLRALNAGNLGDGFPGLERSDLFAALCRLARRVHDAGYWHRDFSAGNILLPDPPGGPTMEGVLVDLNRARRPRVLTRGHRLADLSRLPLEHTTDRQALLTEYLGRTPSRTEWWIYHRHYLLFHGRHRLKKSLRSRSAGMKNLLVARKAYPHLPAPPKEASRRDRAVWDGLSDQPHQHAGRWDKLTVRLGDLGTHLRMARGTLGSLPRIWRRYRELRRRLYSTETPFSGIGICVRPLVGREEELLAAVDDLGVRHVMLRLHPWQEDHRAEEALARALFERGIEVVFALPQRRELVRDLERWRAAVRELARQFTPYGRYFQIGQAINRSKWGVWNLGEFQALAGVAAEELRRYPDVQLVGPGVIDFEFHVTAAVANWPGNAVAFDVLGSLLYVDRRGAPEKEQAGFDTVGKVVLLQAIADTARHTKPRSWITEVNWPLREGPHSPAGRHVSVDEETYADYLARYYLLALGSGCAERVYWWQLEARGYGLAVASESGLRRRPGFHALATLIQQLDGGLFLGPLPGPPGAYLYAFRLPSGREVVAGWSVDGELEATLPRSITGGVGRDGQPLPHQERSAAEGDSGASPLVRLSPSVRYFELSAAD